MQKPSWRRRCSRTLLRREAHLAVRRETSEPGTSLRCKAHLAVRPTVTVLQEHYRASQRLVCRVVGQHRSTQRHGGKVVDIEEAKLRHRLREIAAAQLSAPLDATHIRWGRRMGYRLLRPEAWSVNHKRVQRLWREEGLQRPTPRKRKRARPVDGSVRRHRAEHPHQLWAMDFQFDATADGRRLFTRRSRVGRRP